MSTRPHQYLEATPEILAALDESARVYRGVAPAFALWIERLDNEALMDAVDCVYVTRACARELAADQLNIAFVMNHSDRYGALDQLINRQGMALVAMAALADGHEHALRWVHPDDVAGVKRQIDKLKANPYHTYTFKDALEATSHDETHSFPDPDSARAGLGR